MHILSLSGFIPEQICDTIRFFGSPGQSSGDTRISHYCQYAADFISKVLRDTQIDGAVFPKSCDSCRVLGSYLEGCGKFVHRLHVPPRRDSGAVTYFAESLRRYQRAVETHYDVKITDISERAALINRRNSAVATLYDRLTELSYNAYLDALHTLLQKPLHEQFVPETLPKCANPDGHKVFFIGSTMAGTVLVRQAEEAGLNIVGDRLPESRRLFHAPDVPLCGDIYENIAASVLCAQPSPTQNNFSAILREDRAELLQKGVEGVIYVTQKYCEPYDFLFPVYRKMLDEMGIRCLRLTVTGTETTGAVLAIETFADML